MQKILSLRGCDSIAISLDVEGDGKGKRLTAAKPILKGTLILSEPPLVAIQHEYNKPRALVCAHCFRFVGSIEDQLHNARCHGVQMGDTPVLKVIKEDDSATTVPIIPCKHGCTTEVYCSTACRDAAWSSHHLLLCPKIHDTYVTLTHSSNSGSIYINEFYEHAKETNDVFILAAHAIAHTLIHAIHHVHSSTTDTDASNALEIVLKEKISANTSFQFENNSDACYSALLQAWQPFSMGYKKLWWDGVALPSDVAENEESQFRAGIDDTLLF